MSFKKYANVEILEVKPSRSKHRVATLDKFADWSDHDYRTSDDFLYVRVRAISSRVNLNHDSWPSEELAKSYRSFIGKPLFVEHNNSDPRRTRGVIVDAKLHRDDEKTASLDPYYSSDECWDCHKPPTWVELLLEVDAKTFPKFATAIIKGDIDGFSMGANVERSVCSHCSNEATSPEEFCSHILSKGAYFDFEDPKTGRKTARRAAEHCYDFHFFELSGVVQPADETALTVPGTLKHAAATTGSGLLDQIPSWFSEAMMLSASGGIAAANIKGKWDEYRAKFGDQPAPPEEVQRRIGPATGDGVETMPAFYDQDAPKQMVDRDRRAARDEKLAMAMSAKDFTAVAEILRNHGADEALAQRFADYFTSTNPRFDRQRFVDAATGVTAPRAPKLPGRIEPALDATPGDLTIPEDFGKTADRNDPPQYQSETAPTKVDTLRQERMCPVCGTPGMEDGSCRICQYVEPPEGFDNPDLEKAQEVDQQMRETDAPVEVQEQDGNDPVRPPQLASSSSALTSEGTSGNRRVANSGGPRGRVRVEEKPALPASRRASDKPKDAKVVEDHTRPVESSAQEGTHTNMSDQTKIADGASAHGGSDTAPDKRVDPEGVGAVLDNPLEGVDHQDVAKDVNVTGEPTSTWSGTDGQTAPVTNEPFPASADGVTASEHTAGPKFPDHEPTTVDVTAPIAEPVGDRTQTWSGTEGQADPVTQEVGDLIDAHKAAARKHALACFRLAETEIELGLIPADDKYNRVSELEGATQTELDAQLSTLARVRTAGLRKQASVKKTAATSMPSLQGRRASVEPSEHAVPSSDQDLSDAQAFM